MQKLGKADVTVIQSLKTAQVLTMSTWAVHILASETFVINPARILLSGDVEEPQ